MVKSFVFTYSAQELLDLVGQAKSSEFPLGTYETKLSIVRGGSGNLDKFEFAFTPKETT